MYIFFYETEFFSEAENDAVKEKGTIYAENYEEAAEIIERYYGDEVFSLKLETPFIEGSLLLIDDEIKEKLTELNFK